MHATLAVAHCGIVPRPGHRAGLAGTLVISIVLAAALAAHAQQKASAEDAQRLLVQGVTHYQHGEMQEALAACGKALAMSRGG